MPQSGLGSMQGSSSTEGLSPPKVVFHQRLSSTVGNFPPTVVFQQRSSSTKGGLSLQVVFYRRSSSTEGVFHRRCLPPKVSSAEGCLPPKVVFHRRMSSTYHNTLVDLIFVRTVNISSSKSQPLTLLRSGIRFFWTNKLNETNTRTKPYIEAACCLKI